MRKIVFFLFSIFFLISPKTNAQNKIPTFGVKAGINFSNIGGDINNTEAKLGFNIGATLDYGLTSDIYLLTGLDLTSKGFKIKEDYSNSKTKAGLIYIQLPVHVGYKLIVSNDTEITFHIGPYMAYGIGGKYKKNLEGLKTEGSTFDVFSFNRFDFGLGIGVQADFKNVGVGLGYDWGLSNISKIKEEGKIRNKNIYITLGYKFNR